MKTALATAGATLLALTVSTTAFAHSYLGGSTPADGDIVTEPLNEITLNFDGKIEQGSYFDVVQANGANIEVADFMIGDGTLTGTFAEALPNDDYTVNWSIISADGHPLEGTFSFALNAPIPEPVVETQVEKMEEAPAEEADTLAEEQTSSNTGMIAAIVLAIIAAGVLLTRKKK